MGSSKYNWLDSKYFSFQEFLTYEWANRGFLYLMPLVPFLFLLSWLIFLRFRPKLNIIVPQSKQLRDFSVYLRFIPTLFFLIFIELVLIALARPQKINETILKSSDGIDIVLVMDISESMAALDFQPNL
jgi:Ca-activated chloride channel homolog